MPDAAAVDLPVTIVVMGEPVAQPRPGVNTRTARAYTPDANGKVAAWKSRVQGAVLQLPLAERARLRVWRESECAMQIAIQVRLRKKPRSRLARPTGVPDWDNLAKAVQDALGDARAIGNDSRVVRASVLKRWADPGESSGATIQLAPYDRR